MMEAGAVLLLIVRAVNLVCGALALGIPATLALVVLPAGRGAPDDGAERAVGVGVSVLWAVIVIELVSAGGWVVLQGAAMSGLGLADAARPAVLATVLGETQFGAVLALRQGLMLLLAGALLLQR